MPSCGSPKPPNWRLKNAAYWWDLGLSYSASGNDAKGMEFRQKAAQIDPTIVQTRGGKR
jgi:hypothetical protein